MNVYKAFKALAIVTLVISNFTIMKLVVKAENLSVEINENGIVSVQWDKCDNAIYYNVMYTKPGSDFADAIEVTSNTNVSFKDILPNKVKSIQVGVLALDQDYNVITDCSYDSKSIENPNYPIQGIDTGAITNINDNNSNSNTIVIILFVIVFLILSVLLIVFFKRETFTKYIKRKNK